MILPRDCRERAKPRDHSTRGLIRPDPVGDENGIGNFGRATPLTSSGDAMEPSRNANAYWLDSRASESVCQRQGGLALSLNSLSEAKEEQHCV